MSITLTKITPRVHLSSVEWIIVAMDQEDEYASTLTPGQAYRVIKANYSGGWNQFLADLGDDTWY